MNDDDRHVQLAADRYSAAVGACCRGEYAAAMSMLLQLWSEWRDDPRLRGPRGSFLLSRIAEAVDASEDARQIVRAYLQDSQSGDDSELVELMRTCQSASAPPGSRVTGRFGAVRRLDMREVGSSLRRALAAAYSTPEPSASSPAKAHVALLESTALAMLSDLWDGRQQGEAKNLVDALCDGDRAISDTIVQRLIDVAAAGPIHESHYLLADAVAGTDLSKRIRARLDELRGT